jgi:hypothetical protein
MNFVQVRVSDLVDGQIVVLLGLPPDEVVGIHDSDGAG